MTMMQRALGEPLKFIGFAGNEYGRGKRVKVARCTGLSTKFGYIEVAAADGQEIYVHLDRDEISDVIAALTEVRNAIPAACKECGQVKPS